MRWLEMGNQPERQNWVRMGLAMATPIAFALLLLAGGHLVAVPEIDPNLNLPPVAV